VLPFTNLSGDPEQEYFADGIAEDIITALLKISNLLVISRNSIFSYKGKVVDVQTVGRCSARRSSSIPNAPWGSFGLPGAYWSDARFHWTASPKDALARADELARCAEAIDGGYGECHCLLGAIYLMKKNYDEAIAHGIRAIELEPNAADATATLAMTLNWCHLPEEAAELVKKAMRLSPIHSAWYLAVPAHAYRLMLRYDEAIEVYKQSIALAPNQIAAHLGLTICDAQAGQVELARIQGREILRIAPKFDMDKYAESMTYKNSEDATRSLEALSLALAPAEALRTAA
jgi:tetratricopeptide (TPR) repeat protein